MLTEERQKQIVQAVEESGTATVTELAERFDTSESTIRRDLDRLDSEGLLVKVRGGASSISDAIVSQRAYTTRDVSLSERLGLNAEEKERIGAYAAALVGPDDFVFVDAGSTTFSLVKHLRNASATFVVNSLMHARVLTSQGCRVIVTGGELKPNTEALVGSDAISALARYNFTLGFWGANAVAMEQGYTTPESNEAAFKRIAMEHTIGHARYVLADSSKIGMVASITFADFASATLITCGDVDPSYAACENVLEVSA